MEHVALYRKYRPKTFEQVIGQDNIVTALKNQIKSGSIRHAYLFTGSRGTGKTSTAKIFARAVNCENNKDGSPCLECETCKRLLKDNDVNIIEIDAASNNKVDDIREIREKVKFMPVNAKYKVYIIDEVHMLSDSAFNALLKTLEEPPEYMIFILATTEVHKLPQTILSRCLRFDFKLVSEKDLIELITNILNKEKIAYEERALPLIARAGQGSVRDTLSILDAICAMAGDKISTNLVYNVLGSGEFDVMVKFYDNLISKNIGGVLSSIDELEKTGKNLVVFAKDLSKHSRDLLVIKTCINAQSLLNIPDEEFKVLLNQSSKIDEKELIRYMKVFSSAESELKYSLNVKLYLETVALSAMFGDTDEVVKKN